MEENNRTEVAALGEFGLIDHLCKNVKTFHPQTLKGIGDDAAVFDIGEELMVMSTDMLVEGIHFDMSYTPLKHLGYKLVAVNVSDIAAMNATPRQLTISLAISNRFSVEALDELYEGINIACENYKVDFVGGDTTSSTSGLIISVSVTGLVSKSAITYRDGAKEEDVICVTGDLGAAYLGLQLLEREKQVFLSQPDMQPQLDNKDYLIQRLLKPEARLDMVHEFKDKQVKVNAMIDVSDGLASELLHLAKASQVGIQVFDQNLPIDELTYNTAFEFNLDPATCALNGGEDYELLFTLSQTEFEKIKNFPDITSIGKVVNAEEKVNLITKSGNVVPIQAQGWAHF